MSDNKTFAEKYPGIMEKYAGGRKTITIQELQHVLRIFEEWKKNKKNKKLQRILEFFKNDNEEDDEITKAITEEIDNEIYQDTTAAIREQIEELYRYYHVSM